MPDVVTPIYETTEEATIMQLQQQQVSIFQPNRSPHVAAPLLLYFAPGVGQLEKKKKENICHDDERQHNLFLFLKGLHKLRSNRIALLLKMY